MMNMSKLPYNCQEILTQILILLNSGWYVQRRYIIFRQQSPALLKKVRRAQTQHQYAHGK